jgi:hypothetical protein
MREQQYFRKEPFNNRWLRRSIFQKEETGASPNTAFTHRALQPSVRERHFKEVDSADNPAPAKIGAI